MKITPNYQHKILSLPAELLGERLPTASKDELKVLLAVFLEPEFDLSERAAALDMTENAFLRALESWRSAGLIEVEGMPEKGQKKAAKAADSDQLTLPGVTKPEEKPKKHVLLRTTLPVYNADELAAVVEGDESYSVLIDSCQQILGRIFNTSEIAVIVGLADHLNLPADYILLLCTHAAGMQKTSVRYIEKMALDFYDRDITTYPALDDELKRLEEKSSMESYVRELFGIGRRAYIKKEKDFIENWAIRYRFSREMIQKAYEITVAKTNEASMSYANAVLENWYAAGYTTPAEVDAAEEERAKNRDARPAGTSFNTDDFFEAALQRSYGKNSTTGGENDEQK